MSTFKPDILESNLCHMFFENAQNPIQINQMIYNEKGEPVDYWILDINPAVEKHFGMKREDIIGRKVKDILPDPEPEWFARYDEAIKTGKSISFEMYGRAFDQYFRMLVIPLGEQNRFGIMYQDITELHNKNLDLKESEAKYQRLFETSNDGYSLTDKDGYIIDANNSSSNMLGYYKEEVIGRLWTEFVDDEYLDKTYNEWEFRRSGKSGRYQVKLKRKDKSSIWALISASPIMDEKGDYNGTLVAYKDINEQKTAEEKLIKSEQNAFALVARLEEANKNMTHFISVLSHELRNPMAVIMLNLELQKMASNKEERAIKTFENIERQTEYLNHMINDLLEVTRITNKRIVLKKEQVDLNLLAADVLKDYQEPYDEKEIGLELINSPNPIIIEADSVRMNQIISNLLNNAAKFTPKGGKVTVNINIDEINKQAIICVQDDGEGISPEFLPDLFEPFAQADRTIDRKHGGLGLGLAIVKGMAVLHDGSVEAFSEGTGKGTKLTVRLPLFENNIVKQEFRYKAEEKLNKALRILVIEDNKSLADITCELLEFLGHKATAVYTGAEGVSRASEMRPDIIISDIGLPDMSGHEVAVEIRKLTEFKDTIMIAMSGYAQTEDIMRSKEAGFDRHLCKPVSIDTLTRVLDELSNRINR